MNDYERLLSKGYKPVKEYKRFVLFENPKNGLRECILWCDIKTKEGIIALEELNERIQKYLI